MAKYIMPYNSEVGEKQGYARYAIRFSGGGYLHGTHLLTMKKMLIESFYETERKNFRNIYRN